MKWKIFSHLEQSLFFMQSHSDFFIKISSILLTSNGYSDLPNNCVANLINFLKNVLNIFFT